MRVAIEISFGAPLIHRGKASFEKPTAGRPIEVNERQEMINGVVSGKLTNLRQRLDELRTLYPLTEERLGEWLVLRAVERDLQVAVEIVIDVCQRLISLAGRPPASNSREAVEGCVALGALESAEPFRQMVGFRNIVVHRYEFVAPEVLLTLVNDHLGDFERFIEEVMAYVERQN